VHQIFFFFFFSVFLESLEFPILTPEPLVSFFFFFPQVHVYDLLASAQVPAVSLALTTRVPIRCIGFSPRYPEYLSCGAANGQVAVFVLSQALVESSGGEEMRFARWARGRE
jgi:hypothetical protein